MLRKRLAATVAAAPLILFASVALADTTVSDSRTDPNPPIKTSTGGNVTVGSGGTVKLTQPGAAITLDSNNTVTNQGTITAVGVNGVDGVLVLNGFTGSVTNSNVISLTEDYTPTDTDSDGDLDGPYAQGNNRYGIRIDGSFTGPVSNATGGTITIEGNNSAGILVSGTLNGAFSNVGTITVTGDNTFGIRLAGPVNGNVRIEGSTSANGKSAVAASLEGDITGSLVVQGTLTTTGYRYTTRPTLATDRAKLDADDGVDPNVTDVGGFDPSLSSGSSLVVRGNVTGGVLLNAAVTVSTSDTLDGDNDGIKDKDDTDQDNDGILDTTETGTAVLGTAGSAPALLIGSDTQSVTLGSAGAGLHNYGLVAKGTISAAGVFDGVNATGIQIGGNTGQDTILTNGARIAGTLSVSAYEANATGIHFTDGALANELRLEANTNITAVTDAKVPATRDALGINNATAVLIDSGGAVGTVRHKGTTTVVVGGEGGSAVFLRDNGGQVTLVENTGKIYTSIVKTDDSLDTDDSDTDATNEVLNPNARAIAVDVRQAANGVTVRQSGVANDGDSDTTDADGDGVDDADEPSMTGAVLFGAHNDRLEILNGTFVGDMEFGDGADTLVLDGGALAGGSIKDSDGALTLQLTKGSLTITNAETINATSLTTGAQSSITFTADPGSNHSTRLNVDTANLASGTKIGMGFTSLLTSDAHYTVIHANTLTAGTLDNSLLGNSPYLYVATASTNTALGEVYVDVRRRTAAEIGLNAEGTATYNAFYQALFNDTRLRDVFLAETTREGFMGSYEQLIPAQNEGLFSALMQAGQATSDAIAARPDPHQRYGPDSFWLSEFNTRIQRDTGVTQGSDTKAFGFVAGYESMGDGGALGATLSYISGEEKESSAQVGEQATFSLFEGGLYYRGYSAGGGLTYMLRGGAGWTRLKSDRTYIKTCDCNNSNGGVPDETYLNLHSRARWSGYTLSGGADVAYEARMGRFYARPSAGLDYLYFSEASREEKGNGALGNQVYNDRASSRLTANLTLAFGAEFGRESWWRPELRVGYRARLAGNMGDTVVRLSATGTPFTLVPSEGPDGYLVLGFSLKAGTPMSYLALEGDTELSDEEMQYLIRLVGRVMF